MKYLKSKNLDLEDRGNKVNFLGINFNYEQDDSITISQPQLIDQLIADIKFKSNKYLPDTFALSTHCPFLQVFSLALYSETLNCLEKGSRPNIGCTISKCAWLYEDSKVMHEKSVEHLVEYLKSTKNKEIVLTPNKNNFIEIYADADFYCNWHKSTVEYDTSTEICRTWSMIMYASYLIIWSSRL